VTTAMATLASRTNGRNEAEESGFMGTETL
jgi:hypothetical protein